MHGSRSLVPLELNLAEELFLHGMSWRVGLLVEAWLAQLRCREPGVGLVARLGKGCAGGGLSGPSAAR